MFLIISSFLILSGTIFGGSPAGSAPPAIESITILADDSNLEQVVFKLNGSYTPTTFQLDSDRPRLVFDFHNVRYNAKVNQIKGVGGKIVAGVRVGRYQEPLKTRVVIDINKDIDYQYDQTFNVSNSNLVITLQPGLSSDQLAETKQRTDQARHIIVDNTKIVREVSGEAAVVPEKKKSEEDTANVKEAETDDKATAVTAPEPLEPLKIAEVEKRVQEPDKVQEPEPVKAQEPEPVKAQEPEPVKAQESQPVKVQEPEPVKVQESEPVKAQEPEPAKVQEPEPVKAPEPESVKAEVEKTDTGPATSVKEIPPAPEEKQEGVQQDTPIILDVSFEKSINQSETVLFRLTHFYPPLVFGIEKGEPKVVCDFLDAEVDKRVPALIEAGGEFVNRIKVAKQSDPDKVRVELELIPNRHYDLQQLFFKEENLFVVIVNELKDQGKKN